MLEKHTINKNNYYEANQAIRDILYMYVDAINSYRGFGHNLDIGTFDAFKYLSCDIEKSPGYDLGIDIDLLHEGSAVALLCHLSDYWDEFDGENIGNRHDITGRIKKTLIEGGFDGDVLAKETVNLAFEDEQSFRKNLKIVYKLHILGYFRRLI